MAAPKKGHEVQFPDCYWVDLPPDLLDAATTTWTLPEILDFPVKRLFWLTNIAPGQWRGRHAHRESVLATFMLKGECIVELDDGRRKQSVKLSNRDKGLVIGPWIWHQLLDFSPSAAVLVLASTIYDEAEYIRDYEVFLREAHGRIAAGNAL